jgi:hypothetical protein
MHISTSRMIRACALGVMLASSFARAGSIPLHYDSTLEARGFPSPIVRVELRGQPPARFLIDTGASIHTLAAWYVKAAGIQAAASAGSARGSTGQESAIRVARQVDLALDNGHPLALAEAVVVDFPPMFEELRIAGLLSPQLFAPPGQAAVLDLRVPYLDIQPVQQAIDRLGIAPLPEARVCSDAESEFANRAYSIHVFALDREASVILDSGATGTVIAADSAMAQALASRSVEGKHTQGLGGVPEANRQVPGVEIRRAGVPVTVDLSLGKSPGPDCGPDGLLGMDALRDCLLLLGESAPGMACTPRLSRSRGR